MLQPYKSPFLKLSMALVVATTVITLLMLTLSNAATVQASPPPLPLQAPGDITGTVFLDYNGNGIRNTTGISPDIAIDVGVAGITVTAYNAAGAAIATATTNANGDYTLTVAPGTPVRIEFTGYQALGYQSGPQGPNNGTSVQFITSSLAGTVGPVNFTVIDPGKYCQNNPSLATSCYVFGNQTAAPNAGLPVIVEFPYNTGVITNNANIYRANANQVGTTWGLAYHRTSRTLFAASYTKRLAGYGPGVANPNSDGTGTIYRIDMTGGGLTGAFLDLDVLFNNPNATGNLGARDFDPLNGNNNFDLTAFDAVGKVGLGDLDISDDDATLFVINLADRALYRIPIGAVPAPIAPTIAQVISATVPNPGCQNGQARPFATKFHNGRVFVGGVCTGEALLSTDPITTSSASLMGYVYSFDPNSLAATLVLTIPLNNIAMPRGCIDTGGYAPDLTTPCRGVTVDATDATWRPWIDSIADINGFFPAGYGGGLTAYPQPMLTDIEFTGNDMILGFRDRFADQIGSDDPGPTETPPTPPPGGAGANITAIPGGDILRACWNGAAWILESNAQCGTLPTTLGVNNQQGPNGGEFYFGDNFNNNHDETSLGGLAVLPGGHEVAVTELDPFATFSGGAVWLNNITNTQSLTSVIGAHTRGYEVFPPVSNPSPLFGKSNGLGDLEIICAPAPIEIGNRVWLDTNRNGIQDPGEPPLAGVVVTLTASNGTFVVATTDANGNYFFSSAPGVTTPGASVVYGLNGSNALLPNLLPNSSFTLSVGLGQAPLNAVNPTIPNNDATLNGDSRDSDGVTIGGNSVITLTTGIVGANNHTYDFGFVSANVSLGNLIWYDTNNDGLVNNGEFGIPNVAVELYQDTNGSGIFDAGDTLISATTTTASGYYTFTNLVPSTSANTNYLVVITSTNFSTGILNGYQNSTPTVGPNNTVNSQDNGINGTLNLGGTAGHIASGPITLTASTQPINDGDSPLNPDGSHQPSVGVADGTPSPNNSNWTVDFGFYRLQLGNRVWFDLNNNGNQDAFELSVANVPVRLLDANNNVISTTTTNASGFYTFTGMPAGVYTVEIVMPPGYVSSQDTGSSGNPNNNSDLDDNGVNVVNQIVRSNPITLTPGSTGAAGNNIVTNNNATTADPTMDFGIYQLSVGNFVWFDINDNGVFDVGESPLPNIPVVLYDATGTIVISTTTTDANGLYTFTNLISGTYVIGITPTVGLTSSTDIASSGNPNGNVDSDDNGVVFVGQQIRTNPFDLTPGSFGALNNNNVITATGSTRNPTIDFGLFTPTVKLGNLIWYDTNNDGLVNNGEFGIPNVAVELYQDTNGNGVFDAGDTLISATTTTASGYYTFTNLVPSTSANTTYLVVITSTNFSTGILNGYQNSTGAVGAANTTNSQDNGIDGTLNISGTTGYIASRPITLTLGNQPSNDGDSPLNPDGSHQPSVGVADGTANPANSNWTVDFGFYRLQLGNRVWFDINNNGNQDPFKFSTSNIIVRLLDINNNVIMTTTTDASGFYTFTGMPSGVYTVEVVMPPGYVSSQDTGSSGNPNNNSDLDDNGVNVVTSTQTVRTNPITLTPGSTGAAGNNIVTNNNGTTADPTIDFGIYHLTVGNAVWLDLNNNGIFDANETGIPNIPVVLYDATGTVVISTTTTDANGLYTFTNLISGTYVIGITPTVGLTSSTDIASSGSPNNNVDNDDNGTIFVGQQILSPPFNLTPGSSGALNNNTVITSTGSTRNPTMDFGLVAPPLSLGNLIWYDTNNDGLVNNGEFGIPNVAVELYQDANGNGVFDAGDTLISATTTTASGYYTFTNLGPSISANTNYLVVITSTNFTTGILNGYQNSTATVAANNTTNSQDNGINGTLNVTGTAGYIASRPISLSVNALPTDDGDSPLNPNGSHQPSVGVADGTTNPANSNWTIDFGFYQLSLGDFVWHDINNNGQPDAGEPPLPNIIVRLLDANNNVIATTTTNASGLYTFTGMLPGSYTVEIVPPPGYASSTGAPPGIPSGPFEPGISTFTGATNNQDHGTTLGAIIRSAPITLNPGDTTTNGNGNLINNPTATTSNTTIDFGLWQPASLGDYVWLDINRDGQQNDGNTGVNGVLVTLLSPNGQVISTTTTFVFNGIPGYYTFTNLISGTYVVSFTAPTGFTFTAPLTGPVTSDSNAVPQAGTPWGVTPPIVLNWGQSNPTIDAGLFAPTVNLGNLVWFDTNNDGIVNNSEQGVNGVAVELYQDSNNNGVYDLGVDALISTTVTAGGGFYNFTTLVPGGYFVIITNTNFINNGVLQNYQNSTPTDSGNSDLDNRDHGNVVGTLGSGGFVASSIVTLTAGAEPAANVDTDGTNGNLTIDFGFYQMSLGNLVWLDANNNGVRDGIEAPLSNIVVNLLDSTGATILMTTTTNANGIYTFTGLISGTYIVQIVAPAGLTSSTDIASSINPNNQVDDDDNGIGSTGGIIRSNPIAMIPGSTPQVINATGISRDPTVDFGLFSPASLVISKVGASSTNDTRVTGGSRITYTIMVTNNGQMPLSNILITDSVPVSTTYVPGSANPVASGPNPLVWSYPGTLNVGQSFTATFSVNVSMPPPNSNIVITNVAFARSNQTVLVAGSNVVQHTNQPTAITLQSFTAQAQDNRIVVRWTTGSERDTWGFHLYRSTTGRRADAVKVTPQLILGQGRNNGGASYQWVDTTAQRNINYTYWLQEVELGGQLNEYGPSNATQIVVFNFRIFLPFIER